MDSIINEINNKGYSTKLSLNSKELKVLRDLIEKQANKHLSKNTKRPINKIPKDEDLSNYHINHSDIDHDNIWGKDNRILSKEDSKTFRKQKFFDKLNFVFGEFEISDEQNLGYENFVWRIVRPNFKNDMGPPHRDCWFWNLNPDFPGPKFEFFRIKENKENIF